MQTLWIRLFIHLARLGYHDVQPVKDCHSIRFEQFITMSRFTSLKCDNALYKLTALVSHIGSPEDGHYVAFCRTNENWWLFNDSRASIVNETALFDKTYPSQLSPQTAYRFLYTKSVKGTDPSQFKKIRLLWLTSCFVKK
jgi:ubiquitin C-terminal hydrolase